MFLLISIIITTIYVKYTQDIRNRAQENSKHDSEAMISSDIAALESLGFKSLKSDEVAIFKKSVDKNNGDERKVEYQLSNNKSVDHEISQTTLFHQVSGNNSNQIFIKNDDNTKIYQKNTSAVNERIDSSIKSKLKSKSTVSVIIQMNLPFEKYYARSDSRSKTVEKAKNFQIARDKTKSSFTKLGKITRNLPIINGISAEIDDSTLQELIKNPSVKKITIDGTAHVLLDTSLDQIKAKDVWGIVDPVGNSLTGIGEKIAIIDTGVDYTHADLGGCLGGTCKVTSGYDFVNSDSDPIDDNGHGTHVAAIAAGKGFLNGVAPDAKIVAIKVLDKDGYGSFSTIIAGIQFAVDPNNDGVADDRVDVINISLGGGGYPDDDISQAVDQASGAGVTVVVAAGNSGPDKNTIDSPGMARSAITVGASCKNAQIGVDSKCASPIAEFSSRGPVIWEGIDLDKPDLVAPGVLICAAKSKNTTFDSTSCFDSDHMRISGTSMATPHVAGAALLVRQMYPSYSPEQVKYYLKTASKNLNQNKDDQGSGEIDLKQTINPNNVVNSNPINWSINTDPTVKNSNHSKEFTVTTSDQNIKSLSVSLELDGNGITGTLSKQTLQFSGGQSDSLITNVSVDNDIVKNLSYIGRVMVWDKKRKQSINTKELLLVTHLK